MSHIGLTSPVSLIIFPDLDSADESAWIAALIVGVFLSTTLPFVARSFKRDWLVAALAPGLIGLAAFAGGAGIALGVVRRLVK